MISKGTRLEHQDTNVKKYPKRDSDRRHRQTPI